MTDPLTRKVRLTLDADAAEMLQDLAGGPRKQGKYLSRLIRQQAQLSKQERLRALREEVAELERAAE